MTLDPSPLTPDELLAILAQLCISQSELARRIGVNNSTVSMWMTEDRRCIGPTAALIRLMLTLTK